MPIYQLTEELIFPHPLLADKSGILAVGGDLQPERLLLAYEHGIFPWYNEEEPIIWHAPNPRFVIFPKQLKVSTSMKQVLRSGRFNITFNKDFKSVIQYCQKTVRKGQDGTWLNADMTQAYIRLHELGFAHSVETWLDGKLVGGLYGINKGTVFFGESMFHTVSNASKAAFITLLHTFPFSIVDCQMQTPHLERLGGTAIPLEDFLLILEIETHKPDLV